jgi:pyrroloquinoline quinone (PQQ) biosynthesis protein C
MMKATAPLLRCAAQEAEKRGMGLRDFAAWAYSHAEEEREHHRWYRDDLRAMGLDPDEIDQGRPHPHILRLIDAQFALTATRHPVAPLGFFYATECHTPTANRLRAGARRLAIPAAGLRTMVFHTTADRRHREEILTLLARYAPRRPCRAAMLASATEVFLRWSSFCKDLAERAEGLV